MEEYKTCTKCLKSLELSSNFFELKKKKKDGSPSYNPQCRNCKHEYNLEYMRKKRADPAFRAKELAYLDARGMGKERPKSIYKPTFTEEEKEKKEEEKKREKRTN